MDGKRAPMVHNDPLSLRETHAESFIFFPGIQPRKKIEYFFQLLRLDTDPIVFDTDFPIAQTRVHLGEWRLLEVLRIDTDDRIDTGPGEIQR
jgi:hypothetical protein